MSDSHTTIPPISAEISEGLNRASMTGVTESLTGISQILCELPKRTEMAQLIKDTVQQELGEIKTILHNLRKHEHTDRSRTSSQKQCPVTSNFNDEIMVEDGEGDFTPVLSKKDRRRRAQGLRTETAPGPIDSTTRARYTVMIESIDPRHNGEEIVKEIKNKVDVVEMGIEVNNVRVTKQQKVAVICNSEKDRAKYAEAVKTHTERLTVTTPQLRKPLLRLIGVTPDVTNEKVAEAIVKQNESLIGNIPQVERQVRVVRRNRGRTSATNNLVIEVSPSMWATLKDRKIRIGYQIIPVYDQSPIVQCFRCQEYGHRAPNCLNKNVCGYCTLDHDTRSCPQRPNASPCCANCKKQGVVHDHPAYSTDCPEWQKWDRIARLSVQYC
ncbi:uncharacterized protein LOC134679184 [Cydia fagiglandana]|uniref:uncharacterized protein LOC134679184 n=1 Tax=Cydia fagiglandana TaxID=1458189 RepID=UPI002FEE569A